jgi:hypothetical protein
MEHQAQMKFFNVIEPEEVMLFFSIFAIVLSLWVFHYGDE